MLASDGDNFSIILNSQATGPNIQAIDSNGYKKYFNTLSSTFPERLKNKKFKISINFVSVVTPESTLAGAPLYLLEFSTGNGVQNLYQNGAACIMTNSLMVPLEPYPAVVSATALVSTYWFAKNNFTGRFPGDVFEVRIRNASNFAIQSSFPNYVLQITFEELLEISPF